MIFVATLLNGLVALGCSAEQPECGCTAAVRATCSMLAFSVLVTYDS